MKHYICWFKSLYRRWAKLPETHADHWQQIEENERRADQLRSELLLIRGYVKQRR